MNIQTQALFDLSTLISPAITDQQVLQKIILSEGTPWNEIIDFANQHLLIPALYDALQQKDLLNLVKDEMIVEYLSTVYEYNRIRNESILVQLQVLSHLLAKIDVTPVMLKGAAALSEGHYHNIGARVMMDIDVLVPEEKIMKCIELLESTQGGYQPIDTEDPLWSDHDHHYRRIYSDNGVAALELHRHSIGKRYPYFSNQKLMEHIRPSKRLENTSIIEPSFELYHAFLHSEISHAAHKNNTLELRHLHHAAVIINIFQEEIDWDLLAKEVEKHGLASTWSDYLYSLKRLFGTKIPPEIAENSEHFQKTIYLMENSNEKDVIRLGYFRDLQNALSYNTLQKIYNLKSRSGYPLALVKSILRLSFKYAFSSKSRKEVMRRHKHFKKSRQYGH